MRTFALMNMLLLLIVPALAAAPGQDIAAPADADFLAWALDRSNECDARWSHITGMSGVVPSSRSDGAAGRIQRPLAGESTGSGTELSHTIISTRSFFHSISGNEEHLPLSTRPRNGASRGFSRLQSPAKAHLAVHYDVKRPLNSSLQQKQFFRNFGMTVARPKLNSFGHISKAHRIGLGAVSRPASRAGRPRIL